MKLRPVGSNQTELTINGITILFSYTTPVAILGIHGNYKTEKWYSQTTTRHINKFFMGLEKPKEIPQRIIDNYFVEMEKHCNEYLGFEIGL
tara:strand:+ start:488 stop:760 length:273 start_codon:yes stop_codon:yes gene_type:complete